MQTLQGSARHWKRMKQDFSYSTVEGPFCHILNFIMWQMGDQSRLWAVPDSFTVVLFCCSMCRKKHGLPSKSIYCSKTCIKHLPLMLPSHMCKLLMPCTLMLYYHWLLISHMVSLLFSPEDTIDFQKNVKF